MILENLIALLLAAVALSVERLSYAFAWHRPAHFSDLCLRMRIAKDPVKGLERLFYGFKLVQISVFVAWILAFSEGRPRFEAEPFILILGGLLVAAGQALNVGAIWRLGRIGIFYGVRFGHAVAWCETFPFSIVRHPQYVGTVLSIWGLFLIFRFPNVDWMMLPLLETVYYAVGSIFEKESPAPEATARAQGGRRSVSPESNSEPA